MQTEQIEGTTITLARMTDNEMARELSDAWLVQYELDGVWFALTKDSGAPLRFTGKTAFRRACERATNECRAMKLAHMTAVIRESDAEDCPLLRRTFENGFKIA